MAGLIKLLTATPSAKHDRLNMRLWFATFCVYLAAVTAASLLALQWYGRTGCDAGRAIGLFGMFVFCFSIACTFVPIPTSWFVLLLASPVGGIALEPLPRVLIVAALGAFATAVSHVNEYHVICYLLRLGRAHRLKETRVYKWAEELFELSPFLLQLTFNVVPFPADPARWMAIIYGYPLGKFFLAHWIGRFIRYTLLAMTAEIMELTVFQIGVIQVTLVLLAIVNVIWRRGRSSKADPNRVEEQIE